MNYKKFLEKTIVVSIILFFILTNISATANSTDESTQQINDILMVSENKIEISINQPTFEFQSTSTEFGEFASIEIPGEGFTTKVGEAKLPLIRYTLEIPQQAEPEISIQSAEWELRSLQELNVPLQIISVQPSFEKNSLERPDFVIDEQFYSDNSFTPKNIAKIADVQEIRGHRFILVEISPIQYKPASSEIKTMSQCKITIDLPGSDMHTTYEKMSRFSSPTFEDTFKKMFDNYGFYEKYIANREEEGYLIIVHDDFYEEIEPFAELKTNFGFDITVIKTSDIPGGTSKEDIKDYIEEAYNEWSIPPTYVLLVGDTPQIPTYTGQTSGPTAVDLYYATMDTEDYFPDIHIGRFPASSESHVNAMVEKTIYYENGNFDEMQWIKKAAFMAGQDNYQISEGTHNYVIDTFLDSEGYNCTKLYMVTYGATTQDVKNALNDGRSLAIYSGHGSTTSWGDGPPFSQSDVNSLTNFQMYPFVCSHACVTGSFAQSECFGETWLRAEDKAGLAFWGSSANTLWDEDDVLEKSMFSAWWDDGLQTIGGMTDMALYYLYEHYGGSGYTKYYFECYNVLGDPSIKIRTDDPNYPPETPNPPDGPNHGATGIEYTFSARTTDPEGEAIYYMFDWGDGSDSGWVGPYNSGEQGSASHSWDYEDDFEVRVIAMDENGRQSDWSNPSIIGIVQSPIIEIGMIKGGLLKITTDVKNVGSLDATNVDWTIDIEGGAFIGKNTQGIIPTIEAGSQVTISSKTILGFGGIQVTAAASIPDSSDSRTQGGNIYLFYIVINPSGS